MGTHSRPRAVFLDVGGPIYDDLNYARASLFALDQLRSREGLSSTDRPQFWAMYNRLRAGQSGSFRTAMCETFLPMGIAARDELHELTAQTWNHPPESLSPDALPFVRAVASEVIVGILANQGARVIEELHRDGFGPYISVWGVSELVGHEKPSAELFFWCLDKAGVLPHEAVHVGNRLDNDVRPARGVGMKTVWVLRGEAPDDPRPEQRAEADLVVHSLDGLAAQLLHPTNLLNDGDQSL